MKKIVSAYFPDIDKTVKFGPMDEDDAQELFDYALEGYGDGVVMARDGVGSVGIPAKMAEKAIWTIIDVKEAE